MKYKNTIKLVASTVVLGCIAWFFYRQFEQNWSSIRAEGVTLHYPYLAASLVCIVATYLVPTYGFQLSLNAVSRGPQLSFSQAVAVANSSSLVKYIPGKIWSYALQMYWLSAAGFRKSLVVYVNVINLFLSLVTALLIGLALLLPAGDRFPPSLTIAALVAVIIVDIATLKFHDVLFRWLVVLYNRFSKSKLEYVAIATRLIVELHVIHLFAAAAFALAAYFACWGIGYEVSLERAPLFMASFLLSETIAFFAFVAPGGLGVREGVMYAMLGGAAAGPITLVLPLATRVLHMLADVVLGGTALRLLHRMNAQQANGNASKAVIAEPRTPVE